MNYQLFTCVLQQELQNALAPDITPRLLRYLKNNGEEQDCISFAVSCDSCTADLYPVISLKSCYAQYLQGKTIPSIVSDILHLMTHIKTASELHPEQFADFAQMKGHLCLKLINRKYNARLLHDTPFISYYDLALVCIYFHANRSTDMMSTILIRDEHLSLWNITKETLFQHAIRNSPRLMPPLIRPITELLERTAEDSGQLLSLKNIYVLTNEHRYLGAVCMTYPDVLHDFAEQMQSDLILLPASVHEIILIPFRDIIPETLNDTIHAVNHDSVAVQDRLSDHYYCYDRQKKLISY